MTMINELGSSLRSRTAEESLEIAESIALKYGVTRVTDTTYLDKIGIPVYASIRPLARSGTLCVNAGKGMRHKEAKVGAYMEAIEFSCAEDWEAHRSKISNINAKDLEDTLPFSLIDFGLRYGKTVELTQDILTVQCTDLENGAIVPMPAECVFLPSPELPNQHIFGSFSNGLASGNNVDEATLHALFEVIERDIHSFNNIKNKSVLVDTESAPKQVLSLIKQILDSGFDFSLRYTFNQFGIPFFEAYVMEKIPSAPVSIALGIGCHSNATISAVRAISEAVQSRLSHIHGGRDDIIDRVKYFEKVGRDMELEGIAQLRETVNNNSDLITFAEIKSLDFSMESIEACLANLVSLLDEHGFKDIYRFCFTKPEEKMQVVKVLVPKLESYNLITKKVGPRLAAFVKEEM